MQKKTADVAQPHERLGTLFKNLQKISRNSFLFLCTWIPQNNNRCSKSFFSILNHNIKFFLLMNNPNITK